MGEALISTLRRALLLLVLLAFPSPVFAHRLDEYLQATLVAIEPGEIRFDINLTPGVTVADQVLPLIDRNHDGVISTNEAAAYAELVRHDLVVRLDGQNIELKLAASNFPEMGDLRSGLGIIQLEFSGTPGTLAAGAHKLTFDNRHLPGASVYLVNAAHPASSSVKIIEQKRNQNQSVGEIAFDFTPPPISFLPVGIVVSLAALSVVLFACVRQARNKFSLKVPLSQAPV